MSWHSKKQVSVTLFLAKVGYVVVGNCCTHVIWMKQHLSDYGINLRSTLFKFDNIGVINLTKNMVLQSLTKYIKIKHHFIKHHVEKKDCVIEFVSSSKQLLFL